MYFRALYRLLGKSGVPLLFIRCASRWQLSIPDNLAELSSGRTRDGNRRGIMGMFGITTITHVVKSLLAECYWEGRCLFGFCFFVLFYCPQRVSSVDNITSTFLQPDFLGGTSLENNQDLRRSKSMWSSFVKCPNGLIRKVNGAHKICISRQ